MRSFITSNALNSGLSLFVTKLTIADCVNGTGSPFLSTAGSPAVVNTISCPSLNSTLKCLLNSASQISGMARDSFSQLLHWR